MPRPDPVRDELRTDPPDDPGPAGDPAGVPAAAADPAAQPAADLEISELSVAFGGNVVLEDLSVTFRTGFTGLIGPNGAGKTTCLNVVCGHVRPRRGQVRLAGRPLVGLAPHRVARAGVGRTFQSPRVVAELPVLDNVLLGAHRHYRRGHLAEVLGVGGSRRDERELRERAWHLLDTFGLAGSGTQQTGSLPLGSQKIVEVARTLMSGPRVLLLDEPAAGLGAHDVSLLVDGLSQQLAEQPMTIVIIEHDLALVSRLCPTVAVLHFGRIIAHGQPEQVLSDPVVVDAYLGADFATDR